MANPRSFVRMAERFSKADLEPVRGKGHLARGEKTAGLAIQADSGRSL